MGFFQVHVSTQIIVEKTLWLVPKRKQQTRVPPLKTRSENQSRQRDAFKFPVTLIMDSKLQLA
jgi:hypothetical protein